MASSWRIWLTSASALSNGPVFSGGIGFGILKGGSGIHSRCNFYYYMSLDFLPEGWRLLQGVDPMASR